MKKTKLHGTQPLAVCNGSGPATQLGTTSSTLLTAPLPVAMPMAVRIADLAI